MTVAGSHFTTHLLNLLYLQSIAYGCTWLLHLAMADITNKTDDTDTYLYITDILPDAKVTHLDGATPRHAVPCVVPGFAA